MDDEEKEDYLLRLPTFKDVRVLLDHNDLTGSDDCCNAWGIEKFNGWNQLNHRVKAFHKLFRKLRQEIKKSQPNIWSSRKVPVSEEFRKFLLRPLSPSSMSKIKKEPQSEQDSSSENKNNESNNSTKVLSWHKPEKRKCEKSAKDHRHKKTAKTATVACVNHKKPAHLLSSEDSELSDNNSSYLAGADDMCELDNTRVNGQVSDSTSDNRPSTSRLHHGNAKIEVGSNNNQTDDDSVNEENSETVQIDDYVNINFSGNSKKSQRTTVDFKSQEGGISSEKICREHIFTQRDEEEISKFSFLLDEDLLQNNHVWILQCPSTMDCSGLKGQKLDLSGNCKLSVGQRSYEAFSYRSNDSRVATLAVPSHRNQLELMRLPIAGNIIVEEFLDITSDSSYSITEAPRRVKLPDNLCTRHPLFGKNFKKQLKMAKKMDKVSIKKEFYGSSNDLNDANETLEGNYAIDSAKKKKKKKRKRETAEFDNLNVSNSDLNSPFVSPKKKKIKQDHVKEEC